MKKILLAAAMAASVAAAPAMANTYSFAGDFGNAVFQYGTISASGTFTPFQQSNCSDIGVSGLCYRGGDTYQVEFQRTADSLLIHPGPGDGQNTFLLFTAPGTGNYTFDATLNRGDSGDGVNVFTYNNLQGGLTQVGTVDAGNPTFTYTGTQFFTQGQVVGIGIDRGGAGNTYFNDSTLLSGSISGPVPEPATWAMMIAGFGLAGFALRRRSMVRTTVRYA